MKQTHIKLIPGNGSTTLVIDGILDERSGSQLLPIIDQIKGPCTIQLDKVVGVNSLGAMAWIRFLTHLLQKTRVTLDQCSTDFVAQTNMISQFQGNSSIKSAFGQFFCDECDHDEIKLFQIDDILKTPNPAETLPTLTIPCVACGEPMALGDDSLMFFNRMIQTAPKIPKLS